MKYNNIVFFLLFFLTALEVVPQTPVVGRRTNVVCLVRFADDDSSAFLRSPAEYVSFFNDSLSRNSLSVNNFFRHQSGGKLNVVSEFSFDTSGVGVTFLTYKDSHTRKYFEMYNIFNKEGYNTDFSASQRERELVKDVAKWLDQILSSEQLLDADGNGFIDNLCLVISGKQSANSVILYPHQGLAQLANYIKEKRVGSYTILFDDPLDLGTTCHEFMHTLGAPDLYLVNKSLPRPIGTWDLMATNGHTPQGMSAYTRYRYGGWLSAPVELKESGDYELSPLNDASANDVWMKVQEPGRSEYFVMEYRSKLDVFDRTLPSSGLLVYRINPNVTGNNSSNGSTSPYGQYLFRVGGTSTAEGTILYAALSSETGRTRFAAGESIYPFYSDGSLPQFKITNIGSATADKMRFTYDVSSLGITSTRSELFRLVTDVTTRSLTVHSSSTIASLMVYDINGRLLSQYVHPSSVQFSLSHLQRGTYVVRVISTDNEQYTSKIVF